MKKLLVYSHDAYGLGNIRRMLEITTHLVNADPELSVLLISGSPMLHAFRIPERIDYIKLPCVARSEKGDAVVRSLGLSYDDTMRLRTNVITMAALDFNPDMILVDKKPYGIADELKPALSTLRRRGLRPKCVLLLRDILDEPEATIAQWRKHGYHTAIAEHYDQVLVVGKPEIFAAASEYRFPETSARKVRYCGYLERAQPRRSARQVRADFGLPHDRPFVLVTAGGGADGEQMMRAYLSALARRPQPAFATLLVTGPEMSATTREEIHALARAAGEVVLREFTDDLISCMNAAEVVVAMGGYNTICELLTLRKKAIIVPRVEPVREQWMRAERMQRLGLLRALHPCALTPGTLLAAVEAALAEAGTPAALAAFVMDGLPQIQQAIAELAAGLETPMAPVARLSGRRPERRRPQPFNLTAMTPLVSLTPGVGNVAGA